MVPPLVMHNELEASLAAFTLESTEILPAKTEISKRRSVPKGPPAILPEFVAAPGVVPPKTVRGSGPIVDKKQALEALLAIVAETPVETVRIGMFSAKEGGMKSYVDGFFKNMTPPKFSGADEDWSDFAKEWERHMRLWDVTEYGEAGDIFMIELLKSSLDETSVIQVKAEQEKNPQVTFATIWKHLEKTYMRGGAEKFRQEWERLSISHLPRLSLKNLRGLLRNLTWQQIVWQT